MHTFSGHGATLGVWSIKKHTNRVYSASSRESNGITTGSSGINSSSSGCSTGNNGRDGVRGIL